MTSPTYSFDQTDLSSDEIKELQGILIRVLLSDEKEAVEKLGKLEMNGRVDMQTKAGVVLVRRKAGRPVKDLMKPYVTRESLDILREYEKQKASGGSWFGRNWGYVVAGVAVVAIGGGAYMIAKSD